MVLSKGRNTERLYLKSEYLCLITWAKSFYVGIRISTSLLYLSSNILSHELSFCKFKLILSYFEMICSSKEMLKIDILIYICILHLIIVIIWNFNQLIFLRIQNLLPIHILFPLIQVIFIDAITMSILVSNSSSCSRLAILHL